MNIRFIVFFEGMSFIPGVRKKSTPWLANLRLFALFLLAGTPVYATPESVPPQESGTLALIPVPHPDLSASERLIREQLQEAQFDLKAKIQSREITDLARAEAFGEMGKLYHAYDFLEAAEACYRNALNFMPQDFRWAYLLGRLHEIQGEQEEAAENYQQAAEIEPDDLPTLLRLAEAQFNLHRLDLAEPLFKQAIARDPYPSAAAAMVGLGKIFLARGDTKKAIQYLEAAIDRQPKANSIHYSLAMAYRQLGNLEKAQEHLQQRGSQKAEFSDPLMEQLREVRTGKHFFWHLGTVAWNQGRLSDAADAFRKMVATDPTEPIAHMDLGTVLLQLGDVTGALTEYQEALGLSSGNPRLHYNLGLVYTLQKAHPKALENYQVAIDLDPAFEEAHFNIANLLMRLEDYGRAEPHYARVVELEPSNAFARFMQAMALIRVGHYQSARSQLEKSHRALPEDLDITHALARLLAACPQSTVRDGALALELLQNVFEAQSEIAFEHAETLAMAFAETQQFERAVQVQQAMVDEVRQDNRMDLVEWLQENLTRYQRREPCRQPWRDNDPVFSPLAAKVAPLKSAAASEKR